MIPKKREINCNILLWTQSLFNCNYAIIQLLYSPVDMNANFKELLAKTGW